MRRLPALALGVLARLRPTEWQGVLVTSALIGALGALATLGFKQLLFGTEHLMFGQSDSLVRIASGLSWWKRLLAPTLGGAVAGLVLAQARRIADRKAAGDYMEAIALGDGDLPVRQSLLRALSSAASVSSGGAIGREGPMVQLAALAGSLVGRWRQAPVPRRRLMVACGAAAGLATAYNAPIAGALFVAEIVIRSLAIETVGALLVATVAAHLVVLELGSAAPLYPLPVFKLASGGGALLLAAIGLVAGVAAPGYLWVLDQAHAGFDRWKTPLWLKLAAGGLAVGGLSIVSPNVWGNGYSEVRAILEGGLLWQALMLMLVLKVLAVAATTGSGAVGGIFTPTLFVGAAAGALYATALQAAWPEGPGSAAIAAVGMAAFLAACTHAPLTSVLMIFEMTANYGLVVPSMLACVLAYSISRTLRPASIYAGSAGSAVLTPATSIAADFARPQVASVTLGSSLRELEACFVKYRWQHTYVLDAQGRFVGAVSLHDAGPLLRRTGQASDPWPISLLQRDYPHVAADTPSWKVLETFATHAGERLPVLDATGRLTGHITKTDLVLMFRDRLGGH
jgi:CIC family chloride channel protein